jgi:hypothetical protein
MAAYDFPSEEFDRAAAAAGRAAFQETLAAGQPVYYLDHDGLNVKELPDGRRFEIRWIPGGPSGSNYEIIRELRVESPRRLTRARTHCDRWPERIGQVHDYPADGF